MISFMSHFLLDRTLYSHLPYYPLICNHTMNLNLFFPQIRYYTDSDFFFSDSVDLCDISDFFADIVTFCRDWFWCLKIMNICISQVFGWAQVPERKRLTSKRGVEAGAGALGPSRMLSECEKRWSSNLKTNRDKKWRYSAKMSEILSQIHDTQPKITSLYVW